MGIVTKLEVQKRNKKRVSVYVDDEYIFSLSLDEAARLHKGQELSDADTVELMNQSAVGIAVDRALRLLALRPRSVSEVKENLSRKGIAPPVIESAVERLSLLGYLDDQAFASFWIADRMRFKPTSPRALRYELSQKGVAKAVIDLALSEFDGDESAYQAALLQSKKLRTHDKREFTDRLNHFMQRRGFSYATARKTIRRLIDEIEAETPEYFSDEESDNPFDDD